MTPLTTIIPAGSIIQPGHYFLIQESQGAGGTTSNPTPDLTGGILVGSTAGKIALVASSAVLNGGTAGNCPTDPLIVDFIGYGISPTTATCSETSPTITLTNTTAAIRKNNGCTDTNNNANDFLIDGPIPRNSLLPAHGCGGDPHSFSDRVSPLRITYCRPAIHCSRLIYFRRVRQALVFLSTLI